MVDSSLSTPLRIGIVGLGNAARMVLPNAAASRDVVLAGAADSGAEARKRFSDTYKLPVYETVADLARSDIDAVWVATPNQFHAEHVIAAAEAGKHVVCEKPMALTLAECDRMIAAAAANNVKFMLGHSKLRQAPIRKMREIIDGGNLGEVIQISTWNYNDWLQRPRLAAEVDTDQGGGICYRQAPHQVDIVRYLAGRLAQSVRAIANRVDANFATEGNFSALLAFEGGIAASLVYNAYGFFDVTELTWNVGEGGEVRTPISESTPRPRLKGPVEPGAQYGRGQGGREKVERRQPFYGLTVVSCQRGVMRQSPDGLFIYDENGRREVVCDETPPVLRDFAELAASIAEDRAPFPDGHWGKATVEVCLSLLESSRASREVTLSYQSNPGTRHNAESM
jgi:phthalate 4,5-cis-dihydrodiol dehydrogenase